MYATIPFDADWRFHEGDVPLTEKGDHMFCYGMTKAGGLLGAMGRAYDDGQWRKVDLPHDFAVEQPFDRAAYPSQGFKPRGIAWYRKHFRLPEEALSQRVYLCFDGIATRAELYLNGIALCGHRDGYTGFAVEIGEMCFFGAEENVLAVRVDAEAFEGWWYEGAGIYRHARLELRPRYALPPEGISIDPQPLAGGDWAVSVEATVDSAIDAPNAPATVEVALFAPDGTRAACGRTALDLLPGARECRLGLVVRDPRIWDIDRPQLYRAEVSLYVAGELTDRRGETFGFRTIRADPEKGFLLNGRPLKLQGICNHPDHAGVGVAVPESVVAYRIAKLKRMGCNAFRCSHGNPAPEFLRVCDRMGMLVMNENRHFSSAPPALEMVRAMVRGSRNHPCVVLYSLCNEEPLQNTLLGRRMAERMVREIKALDRTRPILGAQNFGVLDEYSIAQVVDVVGFNYMPELFDAFHEKYPDKPITGTENGVSYATRGASVTDLSIPQYNNFDEDVVPWGETARLTWRMVSDRPFVMGQFTWCGFDYRGEPQPHEWPSIHSHWGLTDTCGFEKDLYYLHQAYWTDAPVLHLFPHWNHPIGETVRVGAYTNCDAVRLYRNGEFLGERRATIDEQPEWNVPFQPGILAAEGLRNGAIVVRDRRETAGEAVALVCECLNVPEPGAPDALIMGVYAVDAQGRFCPLRDDLVRFRVENGEMLGVGNGDPNSHEPDKAMQRRLFYGRCQAIVRPGKDAPVRIIASAEGLREAECVWRQI